MIIGTAKLKLYAPWVHSLKEKRMVVQSIISKVQNKFNVSIAEVEEQDTHQTIIIGIVCVACKVALADSIMNNVAHYIERNTDAEVMDIEREIG